MVEICCKNNKLSDLILNLVIFFGIIKLYIQHTFVHVVSCNQGWKRQFWKEFVVLNIMQCIYCMYIIIIIIIITQHDLIFGLYH